MRAETPDPADFSPPCLSPSGLPGVEEFSFSSLSQEEIKINFAYNAEMLLVVLTAIRHERWLVCIFILSKDMFTQKMEGRPPSDMSDPSQLWSRSSAAASGCSVLLLGKLGHPTVGEELIHDHLPGSITHGTGTSKPTAWLRVSTQGNI